MSCNKWAKTSTGGLQSCILFYGILLYSPCYFEPSVHLCIHTYTLTYSHTVKTHTHKHTQCLMFPLPLLSYLHCGGPPSAGPSPAWWLTCGTPRGHAPSLPRPVCPSQGARWKTPHYQSGSDLPGKRRLQISAPLLLQRTVIPQEPVIIVCPINWKI